MKKYDFGEYMMYNGIDKIPDDNSELMAYTALAAMFTALLILFINNTSAVFDLLILSSIW